MTKKIGIGVQDFGTLIRRNCFYVDKTNFIKEWWDRADEVTLIARPRRFGKTLNMNMLDYFFSVNHAKDRELFEGLSIWNSEEYRKIQGTYPVISISFANVKETNYDNTIKRICQIITKLYNDNIFLLDSDILTENEKKFYLSIDDEMPETTATIALNRMSDFLCRYYGKKVIILLDEYDTPVQEAYVNGFWDELVAFTRSLFNSTFKTNPALEKGLMTGITRISKESIFSDLNNLKVITTTSKEYATSFGFTEEEVFSAMEEMGLTNFDEVKRWYDGFVFGETTDIYNPWSIINYLDSGKLDVYWANTSANSLAGKLIRLGSKETKESFEILLRGEAIETQLDEQIVYSQLGRKKGAVWSLLLASGYLKVVESDISEWNFKLKLTNYEVTLMFQRMVSEWFAGEDNGYNEFIEALLDDDVESMNEYMNEVSEVMFSSFDTGTRPSRSAPERFYHGFVLGLMVDLQGRYVITSNRESGLGRYDIMLEPLQGDNAIIIEFKVKKPKESTLEETVIAALSQIDEKKYDSILINRGIDSSRIRKYGFAFEGKKVLIGKSNGE
ncbi:MAG: AAA family ATPase [Lachnospiraceae bacterium]|nr:AAA family ATPase [Lachnospiraceae bacterium]